MSLATRVTGTYRVRDQQEGAIWVWLSGCSGLTHATRARLTIRRTGSTRATRVTHVWLLESFPFIVD